ncbi:hypothetical protein FKM82_017696 [Ascaphus truei]
MAVKGLMVSLTGANEAVQNEEPPPTLPSMFWAQVLTFSHQLTWYLNVHQRLTHFHTEGSPMYYSALYCRPPGSELVKSTEPANHSQG